MLEDREACPPDLRCLSWRLLHGQCHRFRLALPLSTAEVTALARYPRGQLLASGDAQGRVRLWDLSSGQEASTLGPAETAITSLAFSADGLLLAAGTDSGQVMLWEMPAGVARASLTLGGRVGALAWHPDGRTLAVVAGSRAAQVSLWDARARRQRRLLRGEVHPLTGLAFSPDGRLIAAAGNDHQLWIWDERTGKSGKPLRGHLAPVSGLAFTPDGNRLVSGGRDGAVRVWDLLRETELASLVTRPVAALAMHPTAPTAILATTPRDADDTGPDLRLLDVDTGREIEPMRGHLGGSTAVAFAADGATLATAGLDRTLRVWDFPPRRAQLRLRGQVGTSASVALDRPGRVLAWLSRGDAMTGPATEIVLAEAETGQSLQTLRAQGRPMQAFALSGDGRLVAGAAGHPGEPAELLVWDVSTGRLLQALRGHQGEVVSLVFSPDGRRLASAGTGGPVRLWDVPAGTAVGTLETPARSPGVLAWDGGLLVAACEAGPGKGTLLVWEAASGGLLHQLELGVQPRTLALSARHGLAVVAGQGDRVELFEVQVGELRARLAAGIKDVTHLALSRDAQSLLLAGAAEGVKLWDLPSGQERLSLPGHRGGACFAALADGDRFLLTVGTAQVARLWYAGVPR
jgi:WD40 repeat protein